MKNVLRGMGLSNLQIEVYLKLLEMRNAKVTKLSQRTGVARTQLYPLMENLLEKGFVTRTGTRPTVYTVVEPQKLAVILDGWAKEQTALIREAKRIIKRTRG